MIFKLPHYSKLWMFYAARVESELRYALKQYIEFHEHLP